MELPDAQGKTLAKLALHPGGEEKAKMVGEEISFASRWRRKGQDGIFLGFFLFVLRYVGCKGFFGFGFCFLSFLRE